MLWRFQLRVVSAAFPKARGKPELHVQHLEVNHLPSWTGAGGGILNYSRRGRMDLTGHLYWSLLSQVNVCRRAVRAVPTSRVFHPSLHWTCDTSNSRNKTVQMIMQKTRNGATDNNVLRSHKTLRSSLKRQTGSCSLAHQAKSGGVQRKPSGFKKIYWLCGVRFYDFRK